jgi:hypothetical protein
MKHCIDEKENGILFPLPPVIFSFTIPATLFNNIKSFPMLIDFLHTNSSAILAIVFTALVVVLRLYFWQTEMRELRMFGHSEKPEGRKKKPAYKQPTYADAA